LPAKPIRYNPENMIVLTAKFVLPYAIFGLCGILGFWNGFFGSRILGALAGFATGIALLLFVLPDWFYRAPAQQLDRILAQDCQVAAFDFGHNLPDPGNVNRNMAKFAVQKLKACRFYPQPALDTTLREEGIPRERITLIHPHDPDLNIDTFRATGLALEKMDRRQPIIVISHHLQALRSAILLRALCQDCTVIVPYVPPMGYNPQALQWQCRSRTAWLCWELLARPYNIKQLLKR
jgi:hypothetical protein